MFPNFCGQHWYLQKKKKQKKGPNSLKETAAEHAEIYLLQPQRAGLALETSQMVTRHSLF